MTLVKDSNSERAEEDGHILFVMTAVDLNLEPAISPELGRSMYY